MRILRIILRILIALVPAAFFSTLVLATVQGLTNPPLYLVSCEGMDCQTSQLAIFANVATLLIFLFIFFKLSAHFKTVLITILMLLILSVTIFFFFRPFHLANKPVGKYQPGDSLFAISTKVLFRPVQKGDYILYKKPETDIDWLGYVTGLADGTKETVYVVHGSGELQEQVNQENVEYVVIYP